MEINKILVVCYANINRSPVLAAFLQARLNELGLDQITVESAALYEQHITRPANRVAVRILAERGIDLSQHRSRWVGNLNLREFQLIVCMENYQRRGLQQLIGEDSPEIVVTHIDDACWDEETAPKYLVQLDNSAKWVIDTYIKPST